MLLQLVVNRAVLGNMWGRGLRLQVLVWTREAVAGSKAQLGGKPKVVGARVMGGSPHSKHGGRDNSI